jgi:hypothetical protein
MFIVAGNTRDCSELSHVLKVGPRLSRFSLSMKQSWLWKIVGTCPRDGQLPNHV